MQHWPPGGTGDLWWRRPGAASSSAFSAKAGKRATTLQSDCSSKQEEREREICRNNGNGEKEKLQQSDQTMHAYPKLSQSHGTSLYSMVYLGEPSFFLPQWSVRISGRNCSLFSRGGQTSVAGWVTVGGGRLWGMGRRRGS